MQNIYQREKNLKDKGAVMMYNNLQTVKIVQKNLVHILNIPQSISNQSILQKKQFLGQYGTMKRISLSPTSDRDQNNNVLYSAHVEYENVIQASLAIMCLRLTQIDGLNLKASYGLNKYCRQFLKGKKCTNRKCTFLHVMHDDKLYKTEQNEDFPELITVINKNILEDISNLSSQNKQNKKHQKIKNQLTIFYNKNLLIKKIKENDFLNIKSQTQLSTVDQSSKISASRLSQSSLYREFDTCPQKNLYQNYVNISMIQQQHYGSNVMIKKKANFKKQKTYSGQEYRQFRNGTNLICQNHWVNSLSTIDSYNSIY